MSSSGYGRRKHPGTEGGYGGGKRSWSDVGGECNPYPHSNEDTFEKEKEKRKKNKKKTTEEANLKRRTEKVQTGSGIVTEHWYY
jgi:hypothetical protein